MEIQIFIQNIIDTDFYSICTPSENCKHIVLNLFWLHLNMNLGEDEFTISHRIGEKCINCVDNRKIILKPTRKQLAYRIFCATCELNPPFYVHDYLILT